MRPASIGSCPVSSPSRSIRTAIAGSALVSDSASDSLAPWRTRSAASVWTDAADRVRHGAKLSDALSDTKALPAMAVRMLRLGDETGQLPMLAGRIAEFYEAKLQRTLDRVVGIAGPAAIIVISIVVGGLIVSVMTALMSVSQIIG